MLFDTVSIVIIGLLSGLLLGLTGILPLGFFIILLKYLNVGDYRTIMGTVLYVILFPLSIGSVWEFHKAKKINFFVGNILLVTMVVGSFFGSKLVLDERYQLSEKTIKYITAVMTFIASILFFIAAYNIK
jgi:uncharacterized membrane protein YfcA